MSSSKVVLEMNSKAVSLLLQGKHEVSHFTLQKALESFRTALNEETEAMEVQREVDADEVDSTILHTVAIHEPQHQTLKSATSSCDNSVVTVYNRAFVMTSAEEPLFDENEHTVPAVLLYNMGLSHHMLANQTGKSAVLRKAMQLYTMSFTMLEQASNVLNDMDIMVLLALANNMGVISGSQFYDRAGAETSRLMMDRILSSSECLEILEEEDIEFFSLNLMFLSEYQKHVLAPAA